MKTKDIEQIIAPPQTHWVGNGFKVHNFFPHMLDIHRMSPFVLLDYNALMTFPPSNIPQGVGPHPHRGIETVTIAYQGSVAHHDSAGHGGVIGPGDLQWMTAGSGVLHKEYHEKAFNRSGGPFHMVQVWVNLPRKYKMVPPKYQALLRDAIPRVALPDKAGTVGVIAGNYEGTAGAASTFSPMEMYDIQLKRGGKATLSLPSDYNTGILVVDGIMRMNNECVPADRFVLFRNDGELIELEAFRKATLLLLSGQPLNEPVIAYGPFVMNSREEIVQAYDDVNAGKFGHLE